MVPCLLRQMCVIEHSSQLDGQLRRRGPPDFELQGVDLVVGEVAVHVAEGHAVALAPPAGLRVLEVVDELHGLVR